MENLLVTLMGLALSLAKEASNATATGRRALADLFAVLNHIERLSRLNQSLSAAEQREDPPQLPPDLTEMVEKILATEKSELLAALAQQLRYSGCACGNRPVLVASRNAWRCPSCLYQSGIVSRTIARGSHLTLQQWFAAAFIVSQRPQISPGELAGLIKIRRVATARTMLKKIKPVTAPVGRLSSIALIAELLAGSTAS